jgi:hypothetical protein
MTIGSVTSMERGRKNIVSQSRFTAPLWEYEGIPDTALDLNRFVSLFRITGAKVSRSNDYYLSLRCKLDKGGDIIYTRHEKKSNPADAC